MIFAIKSFKKTSKEKNLAFTFSSNEISNLRFLNQTFDHLDLLFKRESKGVTVSIHQNGNSKSMLVFFFQSCAISKVTRCFISTDV